MGKVERLLQKAKQMSKKKRYRLSQIKVHEVSLVDRGANEEVFCIMKRDGSVDDNDRTGARSIAKRALSLLMFPCVGPQTFLLREIALKRLNEEAKASILRDLEQMSEDEAERYIAGLSPEERGNLGIWIDEHLAKRVQDHLFDTLHAMSDQEAETYVRALSVEEKESLLNALEAA